MSVEGARARDAACDGRCVQRLLEAWPVTGFDDAVDVTRVVELPVLEQLLDLERERSDRPRYRRLLRRRVEVLRRQEGREVPGSLCVCDAATDVTDRRSGSEVVG